MTEYGIFSDEGRIVGDFYSQEEAAAFMAADCDVEDGCHVAECCVDHPEHEREGCEECNAEDDEDDDG